MESVTSNSLNLQSSDFSITSILDSQICLLNTSNNSDNNNGSNMTIELNNDNIQLDMIEKIDSEFNCNGYYSPLNSMNTIIIIIFFFSFILSLKFIFL